MPTRIKRSTMKQKLRRRRPLRKRGWTARANLGVFGNYSFTKRSLNSRITDVVRRNVEPIRHKFIYPTTTDMDSDTWYTLNICGNIPQGDTVTSRSGDEIHLSALKISMLVINGTGAGATAADKFVRIMLVKSREEHNESSDNWGSGMNNSNLLQPGTVIGAFGNINQREVTVVYDKLFKIPQEQQANQRVSSHLQETIKFDHTFQYQPGANYGKYSNYYLVVNPYLSAASTGAVGIVKTFLQADLIFRDGR